jgi:hypothetical protein
LKPSKGPKFMSSREVFSPVAFDALAQLTLLAILTNHSAP